MMLKRQGSHPAAGLDDSLLEGATAVVAEGRRIAAAIERGEAHFEEKRLIWTTPSVAGEDVQAEQGGEMERQGDVDDVPVVGTLDERFVTLGSGLLVSAEALTRRPDPRVTKRSSNVPTTGTSSTSPCRSISPPCSAWTSSPATDGVVQMRRFSSKCASPRSIAAAIRRPSATTAVAPSSRLSSSPAAGWLP